jgi:hypothetical protein
METPHRRTSIRNGIRASLACAQCRSRHLRCDGEKPTCFRCKEDSSTCNYMKSRRGGRKRASAYNILAEGDSIPAPQIEQVTASAFLAPATSDLESFTLSYSSPPGSSCDHPDQDQHVSEKLIHLFYRFFHLAHPCAVPLRFLEPYRVNNIGNIRLLTAVMQYIGSLYTKKICSDPWKEQVEVLIANSISQPCIFRIQALLFYAIAAQWTNDLEKWDAVLNLAINHALTLGIYENTFIIRTTEKTTILAESCRRTWWQLYVSELTMAAIQRKSQYRLSMRIVPSDVDLPCPEDEFESGVCQ